MANEAPEVREWLDAPSTLRGDVNWQSKGWKVAWQPVVAWAEKNHPGTAEAIRAAEERLHQASLIAPPSSITVINAQRLLSRTYSLAEETYHNSLKSRPR